MPSSLTLLLPVRNEESTILKTLQRLLAQLPAGGEILVVNDSSSDATAQVVLDFKDERVRFVSNQGPPGLGSALRCGFQHCQSEVVVTLDADLSYAPEIVPRLTPLIGGSCCLALASPYCPGGRVAQVPWARLMLSRIANAWLRWTTGVPLYTFTGMVRAYSGPWIRSLPLGSRGPEINLEVLEWAVRQRRQVCEVAAELRWPPGRSDRFAWNRLLPQVWRVLRAGFRLRSTRALTQ